MLKKALHILLVCPYDLSFAGGVQHHILNKAEAFKSLGHQVKIIAPIASNTNTLPKTSIELLFLGKPKRIKIWGTSIDLTYLSKKDLKKWERIFQTFNADVLHVHTPWNPFLPYQLIRNTPSSILKVATFHDTAPDRGIGKWIGANLLPLAYRWMKKRIDLGISVSESQAFGMGILKLKGSPIKIIPNGIPDRLLMNATQTQKLPSTNSKDTSKTVLKLLFIGRLEHRKGIFDALWVFKQLQKEVLPSIIQFDIIGSGPLLSHAQNWVQDQNLDGVKFFGSVEESQKEQILQEADVLIAPSLYGESFGIVLIEALASNCIATGYGNSGYLNIAKHYDLELFPSPSQKIQLLEAIRSIFRDEEKRKFLQQRGRDLASKYLWSNLSKELIDHYQLALNEKNSRHNLPSKIHSNQ